jgi:hypothetical protein
VSAVLTLARLRAYGVCDEACDRFKILFGSYIRITPELCVEHAAEFDWDSFASLLLAPSAWAEYDRVAAAAYAEYLRVAAAAWAAAFIAQESEL